VVVGARRAPIVGRCAVIRVRVLQPMNTGRRRGVWRVDPLWAIVASMRDRQLGAARGAGVRCGTWILLALSAVALGCSSADSPDLDGNAAPDGTANDGPPASGGALVAPLVLGELVAPRSGTTPDALEITLSSNLDSVSVRSRITDRDGAVVSNCLVNDVFRVGPSAIQWPIGSALSLPLEYSAALSDGVYVHAVSFGIGAFGNRWLQVGIPQYFEISGSSLAPLTAEQFESAGGSPIEPGGAAAPGEPCPALPDYSDAMTVDGATSSVDFDSWQELGTIQPLRWVASAQRPFVGALPSLLTFHALLPDRGRLQLDLMTPGDTPADFDATFPEDGRILLDELGPAATASWRTLSGKASVRIDAGGRARVELADIVFTRAHVAPEAAEQRSVASGLLVGEIVGEEWP
jgi:hypothetical protein